MMNSAGLYEFIPNGKILTDVAGQLCYDRGITQYICTNILFLIAGYDSQQLNKVSVSSLQQVRVDLYVPTDKTVGK